MRAALSVTSGGPDSLVIGDVPTPVAGKGEVLLAVEACALNYPDVLMVADLYQSRPPRPFIPGGEVAGVVVGVGEGVNGIGRGDRVFAMTTIGGLAEHVVVPAETCHPVPAALDMAEACALSVTFGTSYYALTRRAALRAGETLLVLGAAGGVGIAAVQVGKALGARVIAAVSSEEKLAFAMAQGADGGIVYPTGDFDRDAARALSAQIREACGEAGADVVYDGVGGAYSEPAVRAMNWEGRFLVVGFPAGIASIPPNLPLLKGASIVGVLYGAYVRRDPAGDRAIWREMMELVDDGRLRPAISARLPLERVGEALALLADRRAEGKVVVTIG